MERNDYLVELLGKKEATRLKEQFLKMGFNERMKLKEENPDLFKQLNTH